MSKDVIVTLTGDELGDWLTMKELRKNALLYAERFIGDAVTNEQTGSDIFISKSGVKHTIAGGQDELVKTIPAIPMLLEVAELVKSESDRKNDENVLSIESYVAHLVIASRQHQVMLKVKQYKDQRRYYDHGFIID
jgi:Large polyvalent protein-associated domain 3